MKDKLKWASLLLQAVTLRKTEYNVSFTQEDGLWYVDFPGWPLKKENLLMVAGADDLLDYLNDGSNHVALHVKVSDNDISTSGIKLIKESSTLAGGAHYLVENGGPVKRLWLCPVTLCVLGQYPNYMEVRKN